MTAINSGDKRVAVQSLILLHLHFCDLVDSFSRDESGG